MIEELKAEQEAWDKRIKMVVHDEIRELFVATPDVRVEFEPLYRYLSNLSTLKTVSASSLEHAIKELILE